MRDEVRRIINFPQINEYVESWTSALRQIRYPPPQPIQTQDFPPTRFVFVAVAFTKPPFPYDCIVESFRMIQKLDPWHHKYEEYSTIEGAIKKIERAGAIGDRDAQRTVLATSQIYLLTLVASFPPEMRASVAKSRAVPTPNYDTLNLPPEPTIRQKSEQEQVERIQNIEIPLISPSQIVKIPLMSESTSPLMTTALTNTFEGKPASEIKPYVTKTIEIIREVSQREEVDPILLRKINGIDELFRDVDLRYQVSQDPTLANAVVDVSVGAKSWLLGKGIDASILNEALWRYMESMGRNRT